MPNSHKYLLVALALVILIVSASSVSLLSSAPNTLQVAKGAELVWEKTFGGAGDDRAFFVENVDGGFVVVGSSTSFDQGKTVACVVRFDSDGTQLWNRTYCQNDGAEFRCVQSVPDGFLLVGNTFLPYGNVDGYVVKLGLQGDLLWNVTLRANEGVNKLFSAAIDQSGELVVAGLTQPANNASLSQAWVAKLDCHGNVIWSHVYAKLSETAARAVTVTENGFFMVAGYTAPSGTDNYDFLALKLDKQGNLLWSKTYGGNQSDKAYAITASGNYCVIAGDTRSEGLGDSDAWIIKIDSNGNQLWNLTTGGKGFDCPNFIKTLPNSEYLVAGTTFSFGNGQRDFWLFKVSDDGKEVWSSTVGRNGFEEAYAAVSADNGCYVLVGWTNSVGNGGRYDFYLVKIQA